MQTLKLISSGSRSSEVEYLVEAQGGESSKLSGSIMECWLNWYSNCLENSHSERISEFESQALRYIKKTIYILCSVGRVGNAPDC